MSAAMVEQVRRFNRTLTARIGALDDHFLGRGRPLGEARLLWEIGRDGSELRSLRSRLGLDSGYASRLLRSLERDGLVQVVVDEADRRRRIVRLSPAGLAERRLLEERSGDLARSLLQPLPAAQPHHLLSAMRTVRRSSPPVRSRSARPTRGTRMPSS